MSKTNSNRLKDALLGEPHGTAANRLRKMLLFKYVQLAGHDVCYRCENKIDDIANFSIEHSTAWQSSPDAKTAFFDLEKIVFSHLRCNINARDARNGNTGKTHCWKGHELNEANTYNLIRRDGSTGRMCRLCKRDTMRTIRANRSPA